MPKCPCCGSTAQVHIVDHEVFVWNDNIAVYITYRCGCGRGFVTRCELDRANEEIYDEEI